MITLHNSKTQIDFELTMFPDGTSQIWKLDEKILNTKEVFIDWKYASEADVMHLAQLKTLIDTYNIPAYLRIRYLPYARQDKEISNQTTFALRVFASILNSMNFDFIEIVDPHSSVATDLINNSIAIHSTMVSELWNTGEYDLLCYPDKGALTKYSKVYDYPYIYGEKVRDQLTGSILSYEVIGECLNKRILIVDDLIDGGGTFKILAKDLLANGAKSVVLYATHGIFSKGVRTLFSSGITRVFTSDGEVFPRHNSENI